MAHLDYKGLKGTFQFQADSCYFYGQLMLNRDNVCYEAGTIQQLEESFRQSVDNYLADCAAFGIEPG